MENTNASDFNAWANSVLNPPGEHNSPVISVDQSMKQALDVKPVYFSTYDSDSYKKYLGSSAISEVGINPNLSNREFEVKFDEAQPYTEAIGNSLSKFVDITKDATVNYFKSYYTGADDLITYNEQKSIENNNKGFTDPTFTSTTKSGLGSVFSADFYENLFPSLGYLVGTMGSTVLENIAVDALTGGIGAGAELMNSGRKVKNALNYLLNVDKIKNVYNAEKTLTGMELFKAGAQMYNMVNGVRSEAATEGGNTSFESLEGMKKSFRDKYGYDAYGEELDRMKDFAFKAGKEDYNWNLPILMASNLVQFSDLLIPEVVKISEGLKDTWKDYNLINKGTSIAPKLELEQKTFSSIWKSAKGIDKVKAVAQYTADIPAFNYITSAGSEGMEESLQRLASSFSQDYYTNAEKGNADSWDSLKLGLNGMLTDEGVQEFLGGFMIGSLSHARHGATSVYNKIKGLPSEKDAKFNMMKEKVNYLNDTSLDKVLKSDGIKDAFINGQLSKDIKSFTKTGDIFNLKNSQDHALLQYLWAGYKTGKLDYRLDELQKVADLNYDKQDLANILGVSVNELNDKRGSQAIQNIIGKVKDNKVNFQAVEDYFEKNSNVQELRKQYSDDQTDYVTVLNNYIDKYKGKTFSDVVDKLSNKETEDILIRQLKLEQSKANIFAYNEGVKVMAFAYSGLLNDRNRQESIFNTLSNSSKLNYNYSKPLLTLQLAENRKKELLESIKISKSINDPQLKTLEKQLDILENIIEEHKKDDFMSPPKMAQLLQNYAHEALTAEEKTKIKKDAILMNDLIKLTDAVRLEKKNKNTSDLYNYLMDIKNFDGFTKTVSKNIMNFRNKTVDWYLKMQEEQQSTETKKEETKKEEETKNTKFAKGDKVVYDKVIYTIVDSIEIGKNKNNEPEFAYTLADSSGEMLVDDKDLKIYVKESELEKVNTTPPPPPPAPVQIDEDKEKEDAIDQFIKNNPLYKKEDIEFIVEKDAQGITINKVISKNPTNKGEDLSIRPEFKSIIKKLNDTQEARDQEKLKKTTQDAKIKEFNSEKVKFLNSVNSITTEQRKALIEELKAFVLSIGVDGTKLKGTLKELLEGILAKKVVNEIKDDTDNDYIPSKFEGGARTFTPFKTAGQEEEVVVTAGPNGNVSTGTGKIAKNYLPGTYPHFIQRSLDDQTFLDNLKGDEPMYFLTMVMDGPQYNYERSEEFKKQIEKGTAVYSPVIIVTDSERNPIKFNDDYTVNTTNTDGKLIVYPFTYVKELANGNLNTKFDINSAIDARAKMFEISLEEAADEINEELAILNFLRNYLKENPTEKVPLAFNFISKGILLGNNKTNDAGAFLEDQDYSLEVVKDENAEGSAYVPFRNDYAINGSLVAIIKNEKGEEIIIKVNPKNISTEVLEEINAVLAHDFTLADGKIDSNIKKAKQFLDALIYTKKGVREFVIENNKIVYKENGKPSTVTTQKTLLNIYSKYINEKSEKPKFKKEGDAIVLDTNDKGTTFVSWNYNKFVLDNSYIRGVKQDDNQLKKVNKYLGFEVPSSSLEEIGYINLKRDELPVTLVSDIEANKQKIADLRAKEQAEYAAMSDPNDQAKKDEIYKRYDKPISDLIALEKADIERRRQEELNSGRQEGNFYKYEAYDLSTKSFKATRTESSKEIAEQKINAKYDAELAALNKKEAGSVGGEDAKKAYIEKRRKELLNKLIIYTNGYYLHVNSWEGYDGTINDYIISDKEGKRIWSLYENHRFSMKKRIYEDIKEGRSDVKLTEKQTIELYDNLNKNEKIIEKINEELADLESKLTSTTDINTDPLSENLDSEITDDASNALNELFVDPNDKEGLKRKKEILNEIAKEFMDSDEWSFLKKIVGTENIVNLFNIANSDAWAKWTTSGVILWKDPKKGTGYHEAWHHFSQLYLTKKQKVNLYKEARSKDAKLKNATDVEVEEYLADDFMKFMLSGGKASDLFNKTPIKKNIFQEMWNLLKALFGVKSFNIDTLYTDLRVGDLNNYTSSVNNVMFGTLYRSIYDASGNEIMPAEKVITYIQTADAFIGEILTERNSNYKDMRLLDLYSLTTLLKDSDKLSHIYTILRQKFKDASDLEVDNRYTKKVKADFAKLINSETWPTFVREHIRSNKIGISEDADVEIDEVSGDKGQEFSEKIHDKASNSEDLFKSAPQEIKNLLRFIKKRKSKLENGKIITEEVTDISGLPVLAEQKNLFDRLSVELNGLTSFNQMINKLREPSVLRRVPEAGKVIELLPLNPGNDLSKLSLISAFVQCFTNPYVLSYKGVISRDGNFSMQENTRLGEEEIKKNYIDNFNSMHKNTTFIKTKVVDVDANGLNFITNKVKDLQFDFNSKADVKKFLSLLGVEFELNILSDNTIFNEFKRSVTSQDLIRLFNNIVERTKYNIPSLTYNPILELAKASKVEIEKGGDEEETSYVKFSSNFRTIKNILTFANKYNYSNPSLSYINAKGESEYGMQKHNGYTQRLSIINNVSSARELRNTPGFESFDFENNPHIRGSLWFNLLFDLSKPEGPKRIDKQTGEPVKINIINYNGFQINKTDKVIKKNTADLSQKEKFQLDMLSFLNSGMIDILRPESASSFFSIHPSTYNPNSQTFVPLYITMDDVAITDNIFIQPSFMDIIKQYLEAELYKIKNAEEIYGGLVKGENFKKIADFTLFADILKDEKLKNKLKQEIKSTDDLNAVIENNIDAITLEVSDYFNSYKEDIQSMFDEYNITKDDLPKNNIISIKKQLNSEKIQKRKTAKSFYKGNPEALKIELKSIDDDFKQKEANIFPELKSKMATTFVANHFIQAVEFMKFFEADLGYYKDYFKRSKGMNSTGSPSFLDSNRNKYLANTPNMINALGLNYVESDFNNVKTFAFKDDKRPSVLNNNDNKTKEVGKVKVTQMVHDTLVSIYLNKKSINPKAKFKFTKEEIKKVEEELYRYASSDKMNGADGQGYCTLDFYRFIKSNFGNWSEEEEALFQAEVIKFKLHKKVFTTQEDIQNANKQIENYTKLAKGVTFPVLKINYRGAANNKAFTPVMDKFSVVPLLIDTIKGTTMEDVNEKMLMQKIGYGKFESGSKLWLPTLNELYQSGEFSFVEGSIVDHYPQFIKEQIKSNSGTKSKTTVSTQSRALIFSDYYDNGKPIDYADSLKKWNSLTSEEKSKASWIEKTRQLYLNNINNIIKYNKEKLYEEIGIEKEGDKLIIKDQKKLIETIQKEVVRKGLNKNIEEYIIYDPITKQSILPLDYSQNRTSIGDIVLGIIDKRVRNMVINGSQLIQIAGAGFEKKGQEMKFKAATEKQILTYGTNGLNFYHLAKDKNGNWYTVPMGIKISLGADFKNLLNLIHPDGKVIGTRERLNDIIKPDENKSKAYENWIEEHKEKLTVVGCRIPVGDTNFHDVMMVKEFLPESQGDVIMLPHEVTVKSGTDFDIDKMTFYRPVINTDGTLAKKYSKKDKEVVEKELERLYKLYDDIKERNSNIIKTILEEFKNVGEISNQKKSTYNKIKNYNVELNALYNELKIADKDKSLSAAERSLAIRSLQIEIELIQNKLNKELSSMKELAALQESFFNSKKELKDVRSKINYINTNLDDINHYTNEMIAIYTNILSNPITFKKLITPSANDDYNNAADFIGNLVDRKVKYYKNTQVIRYDSSFNKGMELLKTKKLLGAFAKNNKYGPLFQIAGLGFNFSIPTDVVLKNGNVLYKQIRTLLMTEEDEVISRQHGYISLANRLSFDGKNLQDLKSQGIVSTVDIASDPTFSQFGVNDENVGVFLLLMNMGISLDQIAVFINQPIILKYTNSVVFEDVKRNEARKSIDKGLVKLINKKKGDVKNLESSKSLSIVNQDIDKRFTFDELKSYCNKTAGEMSLNELIRQREIFAHYFHMVELEGHLRSLQANTSWDTNKVDSPISAYENITNIINIRNNGVFNKEGLAKLLNHSFISNFDSSNIVLEAFTKLFPITNNNLVYSKIVPAIERIKDSSKKLAARRILVNDFVESIIKTFGQYKGESFSNYASMLQYFDNTEGADNSKVVVDRLIEFKNDERNSKIMDEFPIIDKFIANINIDTRQLSNIKSKNIEIYRIIDNTVDDQNAYIDQFRKLINHPDKNVSELFKDLGILAFNQSGFNKSFLSFFDIVPFELFTPIFTIAESSYNDLTEEDENNFIDAFSNKMIYENPNLFPAEYDDEQNTASNLYYFRGKDYFISEDDLDTSLINASAIENKIKNTAKLNEGRIVGIKYGDKTEPATITGNVKEVIPATYHTYADGRKVLISSAIYQIEVITPEGKLITVPKKSIEGLINEELEQLGETTMMEEEFFDSRMMTTPIAPKTPTQPSTTSRPTVFEKTNQNTSYPQEVQDMISASKLMEGEYKVVKVNDSDVVISMKNTPAVINKGSSMFYLGQPSGVIEERYGKRFIIPGYEDIEIYEDQQSKLFYEVSTSLLINVIGETDSEAREEIKQKFDEKDIRTILSKRDKIVAPVIASTQPSTSVKPTVKDLSRWADLKDATNPYTNEGIVVTRISNTEEHFGNPFIGSQRRDKNGNLVKSKVDNITVFNTIDEADQAYRDWLIGTKHQNVQPSRREWILKQINEGKLDGKTLLYYKPMEVTNNDGTKVIGGYHSHADTLAEVVEQLRSTQAPVNATQLSTSVEAAVSAQTAEQVYSQLGNKTQSENIVIKPWNDIKLAPPILTKEIDENSILLNVVGDVVSFPLFSGFGKITDILKNNNNYTITLEGRFGLHGEDKIVKANFIGNKFIDLTVDGEPKQIDKDKIFYLNNSLMFLNSSSQVVSTRQNGGFANYSFGNLYSGDKGVASKNSSLEVTDSTEEAVKKYIDWVISSQDKRAIKIRRLISSGLLKGKPILYYKELGEPSHATALDYLINKYDWNTTQPQNFIKQDFNNVETTPSVATKELTLSPGRYVKYNKDTYIVTKMIDNETVQLYNPKKEGAAAKLGVKIKTLLSGDNKILPNIAKIVYYDKNNTNYIVTEKGNIISLTTNKLQEEWADNHGDRIKILKLAKEDDGISMDENDSSGEVDESSDSTPLTFKALDVFSDDEKVRILNNFANRYQLTVEGSENYINNKLAKGKPDEVIKELRTCM